MTTPLTTGGQKEEQGTVPREFIDWAESDALEAYEASSYQKPLGKIMWLMAASKMAVASYRKLSEKREGPQARDIIRELLEGIEAAGAGQRNNFFAFDGRVFDRAKKFLDESPSLTRDGEREERDMARNLHFVLKYVATVLERDFDRKEIIDLIRKKLDEYPEYGRTAEVKKEEQFPSEELMAVLNKTTDRIASKAPTSLNDPAQPASEEGLLHPVNPEGPIPEDIMEWIRAHPDALYVSIHGKYIGWEPSYWAGAMRMYRQQLPALHALELSIIQRDHNWKRIYDQLQEREKEASL